MRQWRWSDGSTVDFQPTFADGQDNIGDFQNGKALLNGDCRSVVRPIVRHSLPGRLPCLLCDRPVSACLHAGLPACVLKCLARSALCWADCSLRPFAHTFPFAEASLSEAFRLFLCARVWNLV